MINMSKAFAAVLATAGLLAAVWACTQLASPGAKSRASVSVDGSSSVYMLSEAIAEEYQDKNKNVLVTVGISGTGGGFKKFAASEIDIADASRPIKRSEAEAARKNRVAYLELPIAFDGISIVSNKENQFIDFLSVDELKLIWQPQSPIKKWRQLRPDWPDKELHLYGPGPDSGTFDYFTQVIVGKERACRSDYTASEDDNVLVRGISGDRGGLGYLGYAYYLENKDKLRLIPVKAGNVPVAPSNATISSGEYKPLSRSLYIYVNLLSARRKEVADFVSFYLQRAGTLASSTGYLPLPLAEYEMGMARFQTGKTSIAVQNSSKLVCNKLK